MKIWAFLYFLLTWNHHTGMKPSCTKAALGCKEQRALRLAMIVKSWVVKPIHIKATNPGLQSLLQEILGQSPTNTDWYFWGKTSGASQAGKETELWPLFSRHCSAVEYLLVATCSQYLQARGRAAVQCHMLSVLLLLWLCTGQGHEAHTQHLLLPGLSHTHMHYPNLWFLQNKVWQHGCQWHPWHSDTCDSDTCDHWERCSITGEPRDHLGLQGPFFCCQLSLPRPHQLSSSYMPSSCVGLYPSEDGWMDGCNPKARALSYPMKMQ